MKWRIPAKTFLIGEYAATANQGAMVLTTSPCFELTLTKGRSSQGIDPDSPAGRLLKDRALCGLHFQAPLQKGGLGASSAEFLGAYLACLAEESGSFNLTELLQTYFQYAYQGKGLRPSGYDLIAQSIGSAYIHREASCYEPLSWAFDGLALILVHTGHKLKTHEHLETLALSEETITTLNAIVSVAHDAWLRKSSEALVEAINQYHQALSTRHLVCQHTLDLCTELRAIKGVMAIKGCGAMGADVLLLLVTTKESGSVMAQLKTKSLQLIATHEDLVEGAARSQCTP